MSESQESAHGFKKNLAERGWWKYELAEKVGCNPSTVSDWCKGRQTPHPRNLRRIERAFGEKFREDEQLTPAALQARWCQECEYLAECRKRARLPDWPVLCERLSKDDLLVAKHRKCLNQWVWWREVDTERTVDDLAEELDGNMVGW